MVEKLQPFVNGMLKVCANTGINIEAHWIPGLGC